MAAVAVDHVGGQTDGGGGQAHGLRFRGQAGGERGADAELGLEEADAAVELLPLRAQPLDLAHDRLRPTPPAAAAHCGVHLAARAAVGSPSPRNL